MISNLPSSKINLETAVRRGCWTIHPIKD
jgi:hypothetical protein